MTMLQITAALEHIGPMSALELKLHMGVSRLATNKQISNLRIKKVIHITRYERQPDGQKGRCIPVYALGDEPDAELLSARGRTESNKRHRARHSAIVSTRRYAKRRLSLGVWAGLGAKAKPVNIFS